MKILRYIEESLGELPRRPSWSEWMATTGWRLAGPAAIDAGPAVGSGSTVVMRYEPWMPPESLEEEATEPVQTDGSIEEPADEPEDDDEREDESDEDDWSDDDTEAILGRFEVRR